MGAKVVNVASNYTVALDSKVEKCLNFGVADKARYDSNEQYKRCKAANRMLSYEASRVWSAKGYYVGVYSCHPGVTTSNVLKGLGFGGGYDSAAECAETPLFCAFNDAVGLKQTGLFYSHSKPKKCVYCKDEKRLKALWDYCNSVL